MSPLLEIRDLHVERNGRIVLEIAHLEVEQGEVLAIVGPNGSGKSTLFLALARLLSSTAGEIRLGGKAAHAMPALEFRRRIALVLQEPLLLDLSVRDNVSLGLRFRALPAREIERRVAPWLERLGLSSLADRSARQLSGGEAQRVSLARAFVLQPDLLLLDEPFSSLDSPTRAALLEELKSVLAETSTTTIFITHDLREARKLASRLAVILKGRIHQVGEPQAVFESPADPQVAAFLSLN
jgi:tungstate transport system ATP-binding protein